jgi:hypothetical protein
VAGVVAVGSHINLISVISPVPWVLKWFSTSALVATARSGQRCQVWTGSGGRSDEARNAPVPAPDAQPAQDQEGRESAGGRAGGRTSSRAVVVMASPPVLRMSPDRPRERMCVSDQERQACIILPPPPPLLLLPAPPGATIGRSAYHFAGGFPNTISCWTRRPSLPW